MSPGAAKETFELPILCSAILIPSAASLMSCVVVVGVGVGVGVGVVCDYCCC